MFRPLILAATAFLLLAATSAQAVSYNVVAFDPTKHAVWIPGLGQEHLILDPGAIMEINPASWTLTGTLTSLTDASTYDLVVEYTGAISGAQFGIDTGFDNGRIKGNVWANQAADWAFAENINGTLVTTSGAMTGYSYLISRYPGTHDYWAQWGTGLNDKSLTDLGHSAWTDFTQIDPTGQRTGEVFKGDINIKATTPTPEPSAALVFAVGGLVLGSAARRKR